MPAKYTLTCQEGEEKKFELIDYVGAGFVNKGNYVNVSLNLTRLFKIAKERPDLLKDYKGEKQIYISTNIKIDSGSSVPQNTSPAPQPVVQYAEALDDEIPF